MIDCLFCNLNWFSGRKTQLVIFLIIGLLSVPGVILPGMQASAGELHSKIYIDGEANGTFLAGQPSKWEFEFLDSETGKPPHHFHEMHQKPIHLVVISQDLENFAHVHPKPKFRSTKSFEITINSTVRDPDNFQLPNVAPYGGRYFVFAEVMPMDYGMLTFAYTLEALGAPAPSIFRAPAPFALTTKKPATLRAPAPTITKPLKTSPTITKWFDENGKGVEDKSLATYEAVLNVEPVEHCAVVVPKLNMQITFRNDLLAQFQPVQDLETWLDSYGHALVIGRNGETAATKTVQHLHAVWPLPTGDITQDERGPFLELLAHSHGLSTPTDQYRTWVQLKRGGRVLTLMFDFDWSLDLPPGFRMLKKAC